MFAHTPLIIDAETPHMFICEDRGNVYFACSGAPLMTLRTFGPPEKCPACGLRYPTSKRPLVIIEYVDRAKATTDETVSEANEQ